VSDQHQALTRLVFGLGISFAVALPIAFFRPLVAFYLWAGGASVALAMGLWRLVRASSLPTADIAPRDRERDA
jgi:hypothetical protein